MRTAETVELTRVPEKDEVLDGMEAAGFASQAGRVVT